MPSDYTYEIHEAVEAAQSRHRERDFAHRRALESKVSNAGVIARMTDSLRGLRPARLRPAPPGGGRAGRGLHPGLTTSSRRLHHVGR
jgi:hypothetical protein